MWKRYQCRRGRRCAAIRACALRHRGAGCVSYLIRLGALGTPLKARRQQEWSPGAGDPARSGASTGSIEAHGSGGAIGPASKNNAVFRGSVKARRGERTRRCGPRRRSSLRTVQRPIEREDQDDVRISPAKPQPKHSSDTQSSAGESRRRERADAARAGDMTHRGQCGRESVCAIYLLVWAFNSLSTPCREKF
ncbi:hypothetical protein B0H13DRAFT_2495496 [Mycena leptocephala]|nr:hypothetical protein B0H13DRAFT_2495496 [Mycena leptocephala]